MKATRTMAGFFFMIVIGFVSVAACGPVGSGSSGGNGGAGGSAGADGSGASGGTGGSGGVDPGTGDCMGTGVQLVYVVDEDNTFSSFRPDTLARSEERR